jgi:RimJ/RimL family protein N-acetyltransferase
MAGDGQNLNDAIKDSIEELRDWVLWAEEIPTLEASELNIRKAAATWILREDLRLLIFEKDSGRFVGSSGLHSINWKTRRFEIGYWGRTPDNGRGYITEAVTAIAQFAFCQLDASRVEIRTDAENLRSRKIPERLGFELEATLRSNDVKSQSDKLGDTSIYVRFNCDGLPDVTASWN